MKKSCKLMIFVILFTFTTFAQKKAEPNNFDNLAKQIASINSLKTISETISQAEAIYKDRKKEINNDKREMANLMYNFAVFRKKVHVNLSSRLTVGNLIKEDGQSFLSIYQNNAQEFDKLLEKFIEIYKESLNITEDEKLASAHFLLAESAEKNRLISNNLSTWKKFLAKAQMIQNNYMQAYEIRRKIFGEQHGLVLMTLDNLANSYLRSGDYEDSLLYYEGYISEVSKKFGDDSEMLLPALQTIGTILQMSGQKESLETVKSRISRITKKDAVLNNSYFTLSARAKSYKYKGNIRASIFFINNRPTGMRSDGQGYEIIGDSSTNFRRRSDLRDQSYTQITPGSSGVFIPKKVKTFVTVGTDGSVIDVKAETENPKIRKKVEKKVRKWKFKPLVYKGKPTKMTGIIYYKVIN